MSEPLHEPNKNCIVYLVDDDRGMVSATSQWLTLSGLNVRAFADPKLILKAIKPNEFCVLVSDIRMPDLDGMSLMSLVHMKDKEIPIILITGHGDIPLAVNAMKAGAFQFLPKPFSPEELLKTVCDAQEARKKILEARSQQATQPAYSSVTLINPSDLDLDMDDSDLGSKVEAYEKTLIEAALQKHKGSIAETLKELDIPRRTLNAKMQKYHITRKRFKSV